jgi:hypothetical protein
MNIELRSLQQQLKLIMPTKIGSDLPIVTAPESRRSTGVVGVRLTTTTIAAAGIKHPDKAPQSWKSHNSGDKQSSDEKQRRLPHRAFISTLAGIVSEKLATALLS